MIVEITEKQQNRFERLAEERYEALRNTIAHLYGQAFLDELETNVDGIISRTRFNDTIQDRLGLLRRQYRTKCRVKNPYNSVGKHAYRVFYDNFNKKDRQVREERDLKLMRKRSKARQRYNRLEQVILHDLGETMQKELLCKAEMLALAQITERYKSNKVSWIKGYCSNDRACALRHLRIVYAYERERHEEMYGTSIHLQINANYRNGMLDYNQANKL